MPTLAVVIIAKNEEARIQVCIASVKNFADEVIVVDNGSTDATVALAEQAGAKVIVNAVQRRFDVLRNEGTGLAVCDWVLQLDADEIVPAPTHSRILETLRDPGDAAGFYLLRKNHFLGVALRYSGSYGYSLKLFRRGKGIYEGAIHETPVISGPVRRIDADIEHYPFATISDVVRRTDQYTEIEADLYVQGHDRIPLREIKYRLCWRSVKLFWKLYVKKKGFKDGMHGLVWCILNVIGPQIKWMKIWEKAARAGKLDVKG
jgi:glycosyltransferase involved in cell wall biosynthesis